MFMKYCKKEETAVIISIPEAAARTKGELLKTAYIYDAFAENRGTVFDKENGNHLQVDVRFPEQADGSKIQRFCNDVEKLIEDALNPEENV